MEPLKIFNSLRRSVEPFEPLTADTVRMYVCGPTVYDVGHLGHGRSAVVFDMIRRFLQYQGHTVTFVSNVTDIDDKMIDRARERGMSVADLAAEIIPLYRRDFDALRILPPTHQPRATEFVGPMLELLKRLDTAGATYVLSDGVYFDVSRFAAYGALSGQRLEELQAGARVEVNSEKRSPMDFVLWKFEKPGEPAWDSEFGRGRPGWHLECSAMSKELLGQPFDIHGGGLDLIFPHHECEIAQSETAYGEPFARYWMHNGFVNINAEKMSKSLGNFLTLEGVLKKFSGRVVRFMYLQTHYRSPIDFSDQLLAQAQAGLERLDQCVRLLQQYRSGAPGGTSGVSGGVSGGAPTVSVRARLDSIIKAFDAALARDFDMPGALGVVFDGVHDFNRMVAERALTDTDARDALDMLRKLDTVLGVLPPDDDLPDGVSIDEVRALIAERDLVRAAKDFKKADGIRDTLAARGILLDDTPYGTVWKRGE